MGIVAANLIAMDVRVYLSESFSKTHRNKRKVCSIMLKDSFGKEISDSPRSTTDAVYELYTKVIRK